MRIAQVAPLYESVPPYGYGGTERVVSYLTEELVRRGHDVTLYASGDSVTTAQLRAACPRALRRHSENVGADAAAYHALQLEQVLSAAGQFDVINFHTSYGHFPAARRSPRPTLTTLHGRLDTPAPAAICRAFPDIPLLSISNAQRAPLPRLNWRGTVYNSVPEGLYTFQPTPGGYLAFLGRLSPEKGPDLAIEIATRAGVDIKLAGKVGAVEREYFHNVVEPLLGGAGVEYVGEIGDREKQEFLGGALALLFPVTWPEPFGLAMIEALACGTPVIGFDHGAVSEVVKHDVTGFVCQDVDQEVRAVRSVEGIDRAGCRRSFEERFSAARMADGYLAVYRELAGYVRRAG